MQSQSGERIDGRDEEGQKIQGDMEWRGSPEGLRAFWMVGCIGPKRCSSWGWERQEWNTGKSGGHMESEESWLGQEDPGHSGDYRPCNLGGQKSCGCQVAGAAEYEQGGEGEN